MPTYEMPILLRLMTRPELVSTLKGVSQYIFSHGGFIREIENWGEKRLPLKILSHGKFHEEANHFLFKFDVPPSALQSLQFDCNQNSNILRATMFKDMRPPKIDCTIGQELLPPVYRKDVQTMLNAPRVRKRKTKVFKPKTGLSYYPF